MAEPLQKLVFNRMAAGGTSIVVVDPDEPLTLLAVQTAVQKAGLKCKLDDILRNDPESDFMTRLKNHKDNGEGVMVVSDALRAFGADPLFQRMVRSFALPTKEGPCPRLILVETPGVKFPDGIKGDVEFIKSELPTVDELLQEEETFLKSHKITLPGNGDTKLAIAQAMAGSARHEAARLMGRCWVENEKTLDAEWIRKAKALRIMERFQGAVTFENPEGANIGGLDNLLDFLGMYKRRFASEKARKLGLPEPKGILLVGVPGCGKSNAAKAIARMFEVPLMRLDVGSLFSKYVGDSEANMTSAIEIVDACSPDVVWIDEIEKGAAGSSGDGSLDSGTTLRVVGKLLTWMQEKKAPSFVIATANNVAALPPEMLRKGRFDEIFFVDLPSLSEREAIARIHIDRKGEFAAEVDSKAMAAATDGFSGAEIEQALVDGMTIAFSEDRKKTTTDDVLTAIKRTAPLSKTSPDKVAKIRDWAKKTGVKKANTMVKSEVKPANADEVIRKVTGFDTEEKK